MREVSAILTEKGLPISITLGNPGSVDFDLDNWTKWHKEMPQDWHFIHTHPNDFGVQKSEIDKKLVEGLALAVYPYYIFFRILTLHESKCYIYRLEDKEEWQKRKERGKEPIMRKVNHMESSFSPGFIFDKIFNAIRRISYKDEL